MSGIVGHRGLLLGAGAPSGDALYDLIMASEPVFYCRHAEESGTTCVNEVGTDGLYYTPPAPGLGNPPLYAGGPPSVLFAGSTSAGAELPASLMPAGSAQAMSLLTIRSTPSAISGVRQIISRDRDDGHRLWQWRTNEGNLEFIKISNPIQSSSRAHGLTADTPAMLGVTVTSGGVVSLFVNGARLGATTAIQAVNYGSDTRVISINRRATTDGNSNAFSESAGWTRALTDEEMMEFAVAAGFA